MRTAVLSLSLSLAALSPAATRADGRVDAGGVIFEDVCSMCHGDHAQGGEDFEAPKLTGQYGWYLETQLHHFRAGIRGTHEEDGNGQVMRPMALGLSDQDIEDVVAYIMTLDPDCVEE